MQLSSLLKLKVFNQMLNLVKPLFNSIMMLALYWFFSDRPGIA